jgi:hypothetical protein
MISGEWLAVVDAMAHNERFCQQLVLRCERCKSGCYTINKRDEKYELDGEELIITRGYIMRCLDCGAVEGNVILTVVPSWIYHPMREKVRGELNG